MPRIFCFPAGLRAASSVSAESEPQCVRAEGRVGVGSDCQRRKGAAGTPRQRTTSSAGLWDWDLAQACPMGRAAPEMTPRLPPRVRGPPAPGASA